MLALPALEPRSRGTACAPASRPPEARRWSAHAGRSGASRRIAPAPPHGFADELPAPIDPLEDELEELDGAELELEEEPLDELPSPRGTAEPTVSPVFGRDCGAAHEGATTPNAMAAATVPIANA